MAAACGIWSKMDKLEIKYSVDSLAEMTPIVKSPNLTISVGLTISIRLGVNVFSIENHHLSGMIKLDGGAVEINRKWVTDMGYTSYLFPLELEHITYAKLG